MGETVPETNLLGAVEGGGTWIRCATGTADGALIERASWPTTDPEQALSRIAEFFDAHPVQAIGVGFFGPLDGETGAIGRTPKSGWSHVPLRDQLYQATGVPIALETDVNAAAIGEHWRGAGQGVRVLVYLTVGTGIGGGILMNGVPLRGRVHPEVGHMAVPIPADDRHFSGVCPFHSDCLEGRASGPALHARWGQTGAQLPPAHPAWDLEARYLSAGIRNLLAIAAPDAIIIGGGVGARPDLHRALRRCLRDQLEGYWPQVNIPALIKPPELGTDSALIGAIKIAMDSNTKRDTTGSGQR